MAFGFFNTLYVALLLINAVAVLNEERFLAKIGLSRAAIHQAHFAQFGGAGGGAVDPAFSGAGQEGPGVKARLVNLIGAVRTVMRIPLIPINILVILYKLVW